MDRLDLALNQFEAIEVWKALPLLDFVVLHELRRILKNVDSTQLKS
jgi:hypothetical protein